MNANLNEPKSVFAESSPLGLLGLAIGCAALLPIAFGQTLTPEAFRTAAVFCLLFGGGCQLIAGLIALRNNNLFGGTLFTTFAFNWMMNFWSLWGVSNGKLPSAPVVLAVDGCFLIIFVVLTWAAAYASKILFFFLLDIDALYGCRMIKELAHAPSLGLGIAVLTVLLMGMALWMALGHLLNASAGRVIFPISQPLLRANSASERSA